MLCFKKNDYDFYDSFGYGIEYGTDVIRNIEF